MIGLGGGSVAKFVYHRLPRARVKAVEVSPHVVAIARSTSTCPPTTRASRSCVADGAEYVERDDVAADVVIVDGYDADSHAEELASPSFYAACRDRLKPGGMLVVNLWGGDKHFTTLLRRIEGAFPSWDAVPARRAPGQCHRVRRSRTSPDRWPGRALAARAKRARRRARAGVSDFAEGLRKMNRHDEDHLYVVQAANRAERASAQAFHGFRSMKKS